MKKLFQNNQWKKYYYFVCFFILCVCDQQLGSTGGEIQVVCPNIVLIVLNGLALSHYPFSSYRKTVFQISAMVCIAGAGLALFLLWPDAIYRYQLLSGALAGVLYGCVLIQTVRTIISEKRLPGGSHLGSWLLGILLVLIFLSHHDKYSGFFLCLSVILLYLTDFTSQERDWMLKTLGCAVLTAFFIFQGLAFVFRPFDTGRYKGLYANTNINALFYQIVYCVFLGFFCNLELKKEYRVRKWGSFCFACAMWPFAMLTMCRSALLGMAVATFLAYGIILWKRRGARVRRALLYVCGMLFGCVISFPVVYGAVRYLPAVFHHPVWFEGEYAEWKVHSWDPYDSEKYTDWRDVLQGNFGRIFSDIVDAGSSLDMDFRVLSMPADRYNQGITVSEEACSRAVPVPAAHNREISVPGEVYHWKTPVPKTEAGSSGGIGGMGKFSAADREHGKEPWRASVMRSSIDARFTIYRDYIFELNLWGHKDGENGVQVSETYFAPHAHNIVLQYAFNFGMPAGIVFLIYLVASGIRFLCICVWDESDTPFLMGFLLFAAVATFSMTELAWRYGQLSHTLLLLLPCFAWQYEALRNYGSYYTASGNHERRL